MLLEDAANFMRAIQIIPRVRKMASSKSEDGNSSRFANDLTDGSNKR